MTVTSIFGVQSGFNTTEFVESLIALQQKPLEIKVAEREFQIEKLDLFKELSDLSNQFKSLVRTMNVKDRMLTKTGDFLATGGSGASVGVTTSQFSPTGLFNIDVTQLAQGEIAESTGAGGTSISSPSDVVIDNTLTGGQFDLVVAGVTTTFFDADLPVGTTAQQLVDIINASGADVTASLFDTGVGPDPYRIHLTANQTGAAQTITGDLIINGGSNDITFNTTHQVAQDATFTLNGVPHTRTTNSINDAITGTTLDLQATGTGNITISVDTESIETKIKDFVDKFNEIKGFIDDQASFDTTTLESGPLFGSFSVRNLQSTLRQLTSSEVQGLTTSFNFLAQIGITTDDDGTLQINEATLASALTSDPEGVVNLFITSGSATNTNVTFLGSTKNTAEGDFDVQVTLGTVEISVAGAGSFTAAVAGPGNTFVGAAGTPAEGLTFSLTDLTDGSKGTITHSVGIAEKLDRFLTFTTDPLQTSPLSGDINTITETIESLNETILRLDDRLALFEEQIRQDFINLEIILGQLDSQRKAFESSANSLGSLFSKK